MRYIYTIPNPHSDKKLTTKMICVKNYIVGNCPNVTNSIPNYESCDILEISEPLNDPPYPHR